NRQSALARWYSRGSDRLAHTQCPADHRGGYGCALDLAMDLQVDKMWSLHTQSSRCLTLNKRGRQHFQSWHLLLIQQRKQKPGPGLTKLAQRNMHAGQSGREQLSNRQIPKTA